MTVFTKWIRSVFELPSLATQLILSFIAVVLLTAITAGLPAGWQMRAQLDHQAWSQVDQGRWAAQALYKAAQSEVLHFATLTAQRPTLQSLLAQDDRPALEAYLQTLQNGAGFDLVAVCDAQDRVIATTVPDLADSPCMAWESGGFHTMEAGGTAAAWLTSTQPVSGGDSDLRRVTVGMRLDGEFAEGMRAKTGLEHSLFFDGQVVASSFDLGLLEERMAARQPAAPVERGASGGLEFQLSDRPYYAMRLALNGSGLEAETALDVANIAATQRRLAWIIAGSILVVALMGSLLGVVLARRISRPLVKLAAAASGFSKGDLSSPIQVKARVRELVQVSQAMEKARLDLLKTLNELRREKDWVNHLLESIVEGIVTLDEHLQITYFSHGAERITGWNREQVLGQPCDQVFKLVDSPALFSQSIPAQGARHKLTVEMADGSMAILSMTGADLAPTEAGATEVALVFRDVSEEEVVHRLLGQFLANVSHEFRTPLSALAASIELLLDQAPVLSGAEVEELLNSLHLSTLSLQTLVDNLLESASIEAGHFRVSPRPYDLGKIISEAVNTMQPLMDKYGQRLVVDMPAAIPQVRADPRRAAQVLVNLLSNASKYGPEEAEIAIRASIEGDWVRVEVADQGSGIPLQYRNDLFQRFVYPVPGVENTKVGAGLGLSVVKAVIEGHGGQVGVEDNPVGGAVFWFTLPRVEA